MLILGHQDAIIVMPHNALTSGAWLPFVERISSPMVLPLCGVYKITCNTKVYVGSSVHITRRWRDHKAHLRRNGHCNILLQRAWNKYGAGAFQFEIIELTLESARTERETYWINKLKSANPRHGYNVTPSASDPRLMTDETREKIRKARSGISLSDEHRRHVSEGGKGRHGEQWTLEARQQKSMMTKGKKFTPEHRAKMSAAKTGRKRQDFTPEHRLNMSAAIKAAWARRKAKEAPLVQLEMEWIDED